MHASREFLDAMSNVAPRVAVDVPEHDRAVCGSDAGDESCVRAFGWMSGPTDSRGEVNCPDCLRLMREATDPVRYDFLRERGLVPELPLVSG